MWLYRAISCDVIFRAHPFHGGHVGVLQCTVLYGLKALFTITMKKCRQIAIHHLCIIIQITACPTNANNGRIATCVASQWWWVCYTNMVAIKRTCTENDITWNCSILLPCFHDNHVIFDQCKKLCRNCPCFSGTCICLSTPSVKTGLY